MDDFRALGVPSAIVALCVQEEWWLQPRNALDVFRKLTTLRLRRTIPSTLRYVRRRNGFSQGVYVDGHVIHHETSVILPGSSLIGDVLIGPHCHIGPGATIYGPTILESDVVIGTNAELRRSLLLTGVRVSHIAYVGHSIVGRRVNVGANLIIAVRNLKRATVHVLLDKELVSTGLEHFGALIRDDVEFGVNVTIYPGRFVFVRGPIMANEVVASKTYGIPA